MKKEYAIPGIAWSHCSTVKNLKKKHYEEKFFLIHIILLVGLSLYIILQCFVLFAVGVITDGFISAHDVYADFPENQISPDLETKSISLVIAFHGKLKDSTLPQSSKSTILSQDIKFSLQPFQPIYISLGTVIIFFFSPKNLCVRSCSLYSWQSYLCSIYDHLWEDEKDDRRLNRYGFGKGSKGFGDSGAPATVHVCHMSSNK